MLPACSSRVRAVCPACLRRKHRSEARPEVVETRYNCGSSHPSRHACRTGWLVAASAVHESRLSFSSIFRFPFLPFPPYFLLSFSAPPPPAWPGHGVIRASRVEYTRFLEISVARLTSLEYFRFFEFLDRVQLKY